MGDTHRTRAMIARPAPSLHAPTGGLCLASISPVPPTSLRLGHDACHEAHKAHLSLETEPPWPRGANSKRYLLSISSIAQLPHLRSQGKALCGPLRPTAETGDPQKPFVGLRSRPGACWAASGAFGRQVTSSNRGPVARKEIG